MKWFKRRYRIIKRFALFPIYTSEDRECRWLEIVYIKQSRSWLDTWENCSFTTKERYLEDRRYWREKRQQ
jgi:hypothetical protein